MFHGIETITLGGLFPIKQDSKGLLWDRNDANQMIVNLIEMDSYFEKRAKIMSQDFERASFVIDESTKMLESSLRKMQESEANLSEKTKKISGNVRKSAHDLMSGLSAIEKMANFEKLERYVLLLERTASAMTVLSELDKNGKLEKVMSVIKN
ncbi:hypothetical protein [Caudoviricetes sp.]|nr:hypothetical protein [Caudoviricetes sp.]